MNRAQLKNLLNWICRHIPDAQRYDEFEVFLKPNEAGSLVLRLKWLVKEPALYLCADDRKINSLFGADALNIFEVWAKRAIREEMGLSLLLEDHSTDLFEL